MKEPRDKETLSPARNFTLDASELARALTAGPPAYMRRLRAIEDLEQGILRSLVERIGEAQAEGQPDVDVRAHAAALRDAIGRLEDLYRRHNRFYPVEANLPIDLCTGELRERHGGRWQPTRPPTLDDLVSRAREILGLGREPGA